MFKPHSITGYTAFRSLLFWKFPLRNAFLKWNVFIRLHAHFHHFRARFRRFRARFRRFRARFRVNEKCIFKENPCFSWKRFGVNVVALVADDYETGMKLVVRWTSILRTLSGNFLPPVVSWPAIMTTRVMDGQPCYMIGFWLMVGFWPMAGRYFHPCHL